MLVEVTIDCIRMSLMNQNRVVILKEKDRERFLPIWIGHFEADAINLELQDVPHKRPFTHDLLKSAIVDLGGNIERIVVTELRRPEDIYYANIVVQMDGRRIEIDSRPSDAIALAVRAKAPIFVHQSVMEAAGVVPEEDILNQPNLPIEEEDEGSLNDRLQIFKDFVDTLDLDNLDDE